MVFVGYFNPFQEFLGAKSPLEMAIVINWLINWLSQWTKSCYRVQLNTILKDIDESVNMIWNWNIQLKFSIDIWNLILIFEIKFWYQNLNLKFQIEFQTWKSKLEFEIEI